MPIELADKAYNLHPSLAKIILRTNKFGIKVKANRNLQMTCEMRLILTHHGGYSFLSNSSPKKRHACYVFAHIPLRPRPFFSASSAHGFGRTNKPILNQILSGKIYEGYIPCTCTTPTPSSSNTSNAPQRSEEWFALRQDRLTTSSFSTALGFWKGNRRSELWHQKVFTPSTSLSFDSNARAAMDWGIAHEDTAIEQYKSLLGHNVDLLGFAVHSKPEYDWLGASPDGVLDSNGILEVKCPYNKGRPDLALPWEVMPYYYMPQLQGLMEVMDREWVNLYCWTPNGGTVFWVGRDREYWKVMYGVLKEFWWGNVMPARRALLLAKEEEIGAYEPKSRHGMTGFVIGRSRKLASEAKMLCKDIGGRVEFFT